MIQQQGPGEDIIIERPDVEGNGAENVVSQLPGGVQELEASEKAEEEGEQDSKELFSGIYKQCSAPILLIILL